MARASRRDAILRGAHAQRAVRAARSWLGADVRDLVAGCAAHDRLLHLASTAEIPTVGAKASAARLARRPRPSGPSARSYLHGPVSSSTSEARSQIRTAAYLMPYNSTAVERDIALAARYPVVRCRPRPRMAWDQKRRSRAVRPGGSTTSVGRGAHPVASPTRPTRSARSARRSPRSPSWSSSSTTRCPARGTRCSTWQECPRLARAESVRLIQQRLARLVPEVDEVSPAAFLRKLAAQGGVVEERITAREVRSPSVQLWITPTRAVELLSTHDQILHGRSGQTIRRVPLSSRSCLCPHSQRPCPPDRQAVGGYRSDRPARGRFPRRP